MPPGWAGTPICRSPTRRQPVRWRRQPLVSVCVPHHNRPRLLAQALESLRQQDYPNLEVVLVDDASTDPAALTYLDESENRVRRAWLRT